MKEVSEQLIQQFLRNQCTAEEAVQVQAYFHTHPEELEKYISIQNLLGDEGGSKLDEATSQKILLGIEKEIAKRQTRAISLIWFKYAAAASIIGLVIFTTLQYNRNNNPSTAGNNIVQQQVQMDSAINTLKTINNTTNKAILVALEDGSSVNLFPKSTLQYAQPFRSHKRQLFLVGTAFFKVAKDKTKPFVVTTDGISTTALGTSFTIMAEQQSNNITVQLFTGKVMISKAATGNYAFNTQYLLPGEQIQVNKATYAAALSTFKLKDSDKKIEKQLLATNDGLLNFNQSSLPEVFTSLQKQYKITITYNATELANMKFTGKFNSNEEVGTIINNIALLNGLTVTKTITGFEIKK
ncbi:FecR family protein [Parasediminibacterium paludis]|uniref:FecR family protein n=1 Tax=Parasediminibacterium paludis TaxID=908966 RepID=A0ABV8PW94_9BACT